MKMDTTYMIRMAVKGWEVVELLTGDGLPIASKVVAVVKTRKDAQAMKMRLIKKAIGR